jgi:hypothetical protein
LATWKRFYDIASIKNLDIDVSIYQCLKAAWKTNYRDVSYLLFKANLVYDMFQLGL